VSNLDEAIRFFTAAFPDFRVRGRGRAETPGNERDWLHIGNETTYVALEESTLDRSGHLTYRNPGINHIGFVVEDIEALTSRLSEAGFKENMRDDSHPSRKRTYYYDADGNEYEFVEYTTQNSEERNQY
ncbi:MAG: VOC family protein, partial [Acidobacteriota bacterium]|nr:VOC family protein [Acidobacteriota bacterium]